MSDPTSTPTSWPAGWAADLVTRLRLAERVGDAWENTLRRHTARQAVDVLCPRQHRVARYGLTPSRIGGLDAGHVELLRGREPRLRGHPTSAWRAITRVVWECPRCSYRREATRRALQAAVEQAVADDRDVLTLGREL